MSTRTTIQAAQRREIIRAYLRGGSREADEVAAMWDEKACRSHVYKLVTIDTIQRDLNLLVKQGKLRRFHQHDDRELATARSTYTLYEVLP